MRKGNFDPKNFVRRHQILNSVTKIFVFGCYKVQRRLLVNLKTQNIACTLYALTIVQV